MFERPDIHLLQLDKEEDAGVLQHGPEHEHNAGDHPALDGGEPVCLKQNKYSRCAKMLNVSFLLKGLFLIPNKLIAKDHRRIEGLKVHFLDELRTRVLDCVNFSR